MTGPARALHVLWATDGSDYSESAVPLLRAIFLPVASKLTVLAVAPQNFLGGARPDPLFLRRATAATKARALSEARQVAGEALMLLDPGNVPAAAVSRWGNPIPEILRAVRAEHADVIVLGAKGHSNLHLLFLGSVSQGVAQLTNVPLLVARPGTGSPERVLVAFDDSAPARKGLAFLGRLPLPPGASVKLVHVLEAGGGHGSARGARTGQDGRAAAALESLEAAAEPLRRGGRQVATEVLFGSPGHRLTDAARSWPADLVVVGSRKPSTAGGYLLASTAERLVRQAGTSVLVVR